MSCVLKMDMNIPTSAKPSPSPVPAYNGKDFSFRKIDIKSSGSRDADGDTFAISGTKMRRAAHAGDFKTFRSGIPGALRDQDCAALMAEIAANLPKNFK